MASYIYQVTEFTQIDPDESEIRIQTTRKYEATKFLQKELAAGKPLARYEVVRSRDGYVDTAKEIDVYEFMQIDLGEVL